jgi:hypothetical protein
MKIGCSLSEVCPLANSVFGNLDPKKVSVIPGNNHSSYMSAFPDFRI